MANESQGNQVRRLVGPRLLWSGPSLKTRGPSFAFIQTPYENEVRLRLLCVKSLHKVKFHFVQSRGET